MTRVILRLLRRRAVTVAFATLVVAVSAATGAHAATQATVAVTVNLARTAASR
jgi:hypothetical protein